MGAAGSLLRKAWKKLLQQWQQGKQVIREGKEDVKEKEYGPKSLWEMAKRDQHHDLLKATILTLPELLTSRHKTSGSSLLYFACDNKAIKNMEWLVSQGCDLSVVIEDGGDIFDYIYHNHLLTKRGYANFYPHKVCEQALLRGRKKFEANLRLLLSQWFRENNLSLVILEYLHIAPHPHPAVDHLCEELSHTHVSNYVIQQILQEQITPATFCFMDLKSWCSQKMIVSEKDRGALRSIQRNVRNKYKIKNALQ